MFISFQLARKIAARLFLQFNSERSCARLSFIISRRGGNNEKISVFRLQSPEWCVCCLLPVRRDCRFILFQLHCDWGKPSKKSSELELILIRTMNSKKITSIIINHCNNCFRYRFSLVKHFFQSLNEILIAFFQRLYIVVRYFVIVFRILGKPEITLFTITMILYIKFSCHDIRSHTSPKRLGRFSDQLMRMKFSNFFLLYRIKKYIQA